jgi:hypothetical protein
MDKNIGFNHNIRLAWLDAAAAFCAETDNLGEVRARLEPIVGQDIAGRVWRRKAIDVLINIWGKSGENTSGLRQEAIAYFQATPVLPDRLWLHYGLTLLCYPFFRETAAVIGQLTRLEEVITQARVKQRMISERGPLGSLDKAVERVIFSLRNWGILTDSDRRYTYVPQRQGLSASRPELEAWLLACALHAHPAEELPFTDLIRLPELFPFRFTLTVDHLRQHPRFVVQRQGAGWDMVRVVKRAEATPPVEGAAPSRQ